MVSPSYIIFYKKGFWEVNIDRLFFWYYDRKYLFYYAASFWMKTIYKIDYVRGYNLQVIRKKIVNFCMFS